MTKCAINIIGLTLICVFLCSCSDLASRIPTYTEEDEKMYKALIDINEQEFIEAVNEGADPNKFETSHGGTYSPLVYAVNCGEGAAINRLVDTILSYDIDPNMTDSSFLGLSDKLVFEKIFDNSTVFYALLPKVDLDKYGERIIDTVTAERYSVGYYRALIKHGAVVTENNINNLADEIRYELKDYSINSYCYILPDICSLEILINNYNGDSDSSLYRAYKGTFSEKDECDEALVLYGVAAACGSDVLAKFITEDTDIDYLLRIAVMCGNIDNVNYLVGQGANLGFIEEKTYMNVLRYAVRFDTVETAEHVLSLNNEDVNDCLYFAASDDNFEMVKLLIDNGADVNYEKAFVAATYSTPQIIKYFIDNGCELNKRTESLNERYIVEMFGQSDTDSVKYALGFCEGLNENEILRAIEKCVFHGDLETLKYLKELGASDFNDTFVFEGSDYKSENVPLEVAVERGYFDIVKFLVENGATIESMSEIRYNNFFIHYAKRSTEIYNYLITKGIINEASYVTDEP